MILAVLLALNAPINANAQSSGAKANLSGRKLEQRIEAVLKQQGFEIIPYRNWRQGLIYQRPNIRFAILDAPYKTIYDANSKIEFLLITGNREILIEAKFQGSSGSFDEKLAFVYLTALENMPEREYVLVIGGDGWRDKARQWITERAEKTPGFTVLRLWDLEQWLNLSLCEEDKTVTPGTCTQKPREPKMELN